jgi:hypothetical protein
MCVEHSRGVLERAGPCVEKNSLVHKNSWRKQGSSSITWGVVAGEDNCG